MYGGILQYTFLQYYHHLLFDKLFLSNCKKKGGIFFINKIKSYLFLGRIYIVPPRLFIQECSQNNFSPLLLDHI